MEPGDGAVDRDPAGLVLSGQNGIAAWQDDLTGHFTSIRNWVIRRLKPSATAARLLTGFGFGVREKIGSTGVVGILKNGDGPTVLVRADMDALPMAEDTGLDYASTDTATDEAGNTVPVAHACGHDVHIASLLGLHGCWQPTERPGVALSWHSSSQPRSWQMGRAGWSGAGWPT